MFWISCDDVLCLEYLMMHLYVLNILWRCRFWICCDAVLCSEYLVTLSYVLNILWCYPMFRIFYESALCFECLETLSFLSISSAPFSKRTAYYERWVASNRSTWSSLVQGTHILETWRMTPFANCDYKCMSKRIHLIRNEIKKFWYRFYHFERKARCVDCEHIWKSQIELCYELYSLVC